MSRTLPTIELMNDLFFVDIAMGGFRNSQPPFNVLRFEDMEKIIYPRNVEYFLRFLYDGRNKEMFVPTEKVNKMPHQVHCLEIAPPALLDPIGAARKMGITSDLLPDDYDYPQPMHYHPREIPGIEILGTDFFVDTFNMQFRQALNPANTISFEHVIVGRTKMFFDYNVHTKTLARKTGDEDEDAIAIAVLPLLKDIDPEGWKMMQEAFTEKNRKRVIKPDTKRGRGRNI